MLPKGLLISAPASGTGKTTLMLGLCRALTQAGVTVQPFKSGPDYIDPGFHSAAAGRVSVNLDSWAMPRGLLADLVQAADGADLVLAEGSMGLFDGVASPGETGTGASADMAALMGWPWYWSSTSRAKRNPPPPSPQALPPCAPMCSLRAWF